MDSRSLQSTYCVPGTVWNTLHTGLFPELVLEVDAPSSFSGRVEINDLSSVAEDTMGLYPVLVGSEVVGLMTASCLPQKRRPAGNLDSTVSSEV